MNSEPSFHAAEESDSETLLLLMSEYYAFDGHGFDEQKARTALIRLCGKRIWDGCG